MTNSTKDKSVTVFENLLSPLKVGHLTLRNRVLVTAHELSMGKDGLPTEDFVEYHRTLAAGGPGLQITGATSIHPTGASTSQSLMNHDDRIIPEYRKLADAVHQEGGRILAQLGHFGALANWGFSEKPLWSPSRFPSEVAREVPHEMTKIEIKEVVAAYGQAARRVKEGGLDGIELTASHGLLVASFLSGYSNHRTDEYGGSLDNRLRFLLEIIDEVSEQAGDDLILGVRLPGDEFVKNGINPEEAKEIAQKLENSGKVHYINVITGTNLDRFQRFSHIPPTPSENGLFVNLAKGIKEVVNIPVFTVGRIVEPSHAERILSEGAADMVGMTRAHIADPNIINKIKENRVEDIRPCVGANVCISSSRGGRPIRCIHNPEAGRANLFPAIKKVLEPKRVFVIGGGPAGLEAARIAALRGHIVELFERQDRLGGQLHLWATSPSMSELYKIIEWQKSQLEKLQVKVHLNTEITASEIIRQAPDSVIVATGSKPRTPNVHSSLFNVNGAFDSNIRILSSQEFLESNIQNVKKAIVWDYEGGMAGSQAAMSAAELLLENGSLVEVVSPNLMVGEDITLTLRVPMYQRILPTGAIFTPNSEISRVEGTSVSIRNLFSDQEKLVSDVELIVTNLGSEVNVSLYQSLLHQLPEVHAIGDCLAPRTVEFAMSDGAKIARAL